MEFKFGSLNWFTWFAVIRRVLCIVDYLKVKIVRKTVNTNLYPLIFIWFERVKSGDYLTLILLLSIVGKIVGFRFNFLMK